jgi:prenyltransferase beta subunit
MGVSCVRENNISENILKKTISHIISAQDVSGAWSRLKGEFPCETEPTSWAVKVLSMGKAAPDRVEKGVQFILHDQQPDGSWNNNAAHTAFAIIALQETGMSVEATEKAISYLRKVQHEEGGFQRTAGAGESSTLHAAIVLFAMREAGFGIGDPMVRKALVWLVSCQNEDGGYGVSRGGLSVAFATARAVKALRMYGTPLAEPFVRDGIAWLMTMQEESGGFAMSSDSTEDPEITAYAMTVMNGLDVYKTHMQKAIAYLERVQEADGTFKSYAPIQFNNVTKKNTQTTCFVAWTLLEMRGLKQRDEPPLH